MAGIIIFRREMRLALQQSWAAVLGFFLLVVLIFVLGAAETHTPNAATIIWSALLLAHLLILPRFFEEDLALGVLDLMLMEVPVPVWIIIAKSFALWMAAILPLIALVPIAGIMLGLAPAALLPLTYSALVGSLGLVFLGAFAAALTAGLRAAAWLAPLIIMPLELPLLIFGSATARTAWNQFFISPANLLLIGLVLLAIVLSPPLAAFALKAREG